MDRGEVMNVIGTGFWIEFFLIIGGSFFAIYLFNIVMKRVLKVERGFFSSYYVNEQHKKIERYVRISMVVLMVVGFIVNINRFGVDPIWFLETWFLLFVLIAVTEGLRAVMEWKHAENRNDYKFTVLQLLFIFMIIAILSMTYFLGG